VETKNTKEKIKVFFSAPATSEPDQRKLYQSIIDEIVSLGGHITYDWLNDTKDFDPKSTTKKSVKAIEISDVLVAENTTASTGVGGQIALAQAKKIPVIILTNGESEGKGGFFSFSDFGEGVNVYQYTRQDLHKTLKNAFHAVSKLRFVKFNFISTPEINQALDDGARVSRLSKSEFLRKILENHFHL